MGEDSKVAIRSIRRDGIDEFKTMQKNSEITEDELKMAEDNIQKITDKSIEEIDKLTDGKEKEINIDEIVIDDLIVLDSGKQICADSVVMSGEVEVNESLLTGESDTILKQKGDKLLSFDMDLVKEKGYKTQTMFLVADAKGKEVEVVEAADADNNTKIMNLK